jgi:hypothetical protein
MSDEQTIEELDFVADLDDDEAIEPLGVEELEPTRIDQLEAAIRTLSAQQVTIERQRVRRKVTAATGGASLAAFLPIALQLVDALHMTAEVASTVAAVAGAAGAFLAGYVTPERAQPAEVLTP